MKSVFILAGVLALAACGGGGGTSSATSSSTSSSSSSGAGTTSTSSSSSSSSSSSGSSGGVSSGSSSGSSSGTGIQTADDAVTAYTGLFAYGSNTGYFGWNNNDQQVASLLLGGGSTGLPGVGVHSLRTALYDDFLQTYGNTVRTAEFSLYQNLGAKDLVLFINAAYHVTGTRRDSKSYGGCANQSWMHANMYKPIWITQNGQQVVNPENYLAQYVANVVNTYKQYGIRFYEVWNEPDFTYNTDAAGNSAASGYWGKVNPSPCDMPNTYAPISHHVRLHRVVYEVVKALDPTAYVATGGIGYPGYLQALLRNTDNPGTANAQNAGEADGDVEGAVSARYPKTGGAWFDVLSFHSYPQYALSYWIGGGTCKSGETKRLPPNSSSGSERCYFEHSDAAVAQMLQLKSSMQSVLSAAGYDGTTHPQKIFIVTESNVPRVPARYKDSTGTQLSTQIDQWGGDDYARDYVIKALVLSQKNDIRQFHIYAPSDEVREDGTDCSGNMVGTDNTKVQGLFQDLACVSGPASAVATVQATAYTTTSDFLYGYRYDAARTTALALPTSVDGAAFKNDAGAWRYVLWAKTGTDRSESASANYSFPGAFGMSTVQRREWDYSSTHATTSTTPGGISLGGAPSYFE